MISSVKIVCWFFRIWGNWRSIWHSSITLTMTNSSKGSWNHRSLKIISTISLGSISISNRTINKISSNSKITMATTLKTSSLVSRTKKPVLRRITIRMKLSISGISYCSVIWKNMLRIMIIVSTTISIEKWRAREKIMRMDKVW